MTSGMTPYTLLACLSYFTVSCNIQGPGLSPAELVFDPSSIEWVPRVLAAVQSGRSVNLTTHLHLVLWSRKRGGLNPTLLIGCSVKVLCLSTVETFNLTNRPKFLLKLQ
jgi:hypothetical protein